MRATLCWIRISLLLTAFCAGGQVFATEPTHSVIPTKELMSVEVFRAQDGSAVSLADLGLGRQPVLFVLWATWCQPCVKEMPRIRELHQRYGKAIRFVGIAQDLNNSFNRRTVRELAAPVQLGYSQFLEKDGQTMLTRMFGPKQTALPAFVLYGSKGGRLHGQVGSLENADNLSTLSSELAKLAGASGTSQGQ